MNLFNLSLDVEEEENNFPDLHTDYIPLSNENKKKLSTIKSKKKCISIKSSGKGAFGNIKIEKDHVLKKVDLLPANFIKVGSFSYPEKIDFIVKRLEKYCVDVKKYIKKVKKYFPENILEVYDCKYCNENGKIIIIFKMERNSTHERDMSYMLKNNLLSKKEIESLINQIKEISLTLNKENIYHNDLKPANILIAKTDKDITYPSGLKINKGERIPILIDYDLHSLDKLRLPDLGDGVVEIPQNDFDFFILTYKKIIKNQKGGKRKKIKKVKKIRKHKGIDQKTGKLKKGYKYTDKKLKNGLYQIIKK
jgi:serine/threonine protein kinase